MIVDTVIELTDAERGFLLLEDESGQLVVKVARNIDQRTLETAEFELSRSIARQAAAGGEPIVTIDAAGDARFSEAMSVSDLHLRSVLAVPLRVKGRVGRHDLRRPPAAQGRVRSGRRRPGARLRRAGGDRDRERAPARRAAPARAPGRGAQPAPRGRAGRARREELSGIKQELRENREALAVRYDYRNIVGRTPRMLELFRLLDRVTDTTLPVVIQGESGTGKELVARAIHFNGPRRERPFVGENCAAIPETLLESTLFGYVRGAFTGAERDTRGLFEVADGGTLFLDEVGEMSPGMQGKLLRVLQAGRAPPRRQRADAQGRRPHRRRDATAISRAWSRRGSSARTCTSASTSRASSLPPLRERRDDIPLIVAHFARQARRRRRPRRRRGAEAASTRRCWRACRLPLAGQRARARERDHARRWRCRASASRSPTSRPRSRPRGDGRRACAEDPDSLPLQPRVERLERSLIREALGRCGNNQTKAAEALGLSRFGLQKKLRRYNFA